MESRRDCRFMVAFRRYAEIPFAGLLQVGSLWAISNEKHSLSRNLLSKLRSNEYASSLKQKYKSTTNITSSITTNTDTAPSKQTPNRTKTNEFTYLTMSNKIQLLALHNKNKTPHVYLGITHKPRSSSVIFLPRRADGYSSVVQIQNQANKVKERELCCKSQKCRSFLFFHCVRFIYP